MKGEFYSCVVMISKAKMGNCGKENSIVEFKLMCSPWMDNYRTHHKSQLLLDGFHINPSWIPYTETFHFVLIGHPLLSLYYALSVVGSMAVVFN